MASFMNHTGDEGKASSLPGGAGLYDGRAGTPSPELPGGRRRTGTGALPARQRNGRANAWVVDVVILLLLAALGVGIWFGYRYLKQKYAPLWEQRTVTYCILVEGLDPELITYGPDGQVTLCGQTVYASDREEADNLGTVMSAETVLITREGEKESVDLYLYVEAETRYQAGYGYWAGDTRLLAGSQGTYRLFGLIVRGQIISLEEKSAETTPETGAETEEAEPGAGTVQDTAPAGAEGKG